MAESISLKEARRIALAAQGFDRPRPRGRIGVSHIIRTIRQLGLMQIDFVNVLVPAPYQVLFSRLGPYRRSLLHEAVYKRGEFTEQWAHEASIVPVEIWPLLRHRMDNHRMRPWGFEKFLNDSDYFSWVLEQVRALGPLTAEDLPKREGTPNRIPGAWIASVQRAVLEGHFGRGALAVTERLPNFARVYDLAERVLRPEHHGRQVDRHQAERELLLLAARSHGVGTAEDLADYYRMPVKGARPRIAELVEAGYVRETQVEGWRQSAYLHPDARLPRKIEAQALLSPFDPVVWYRPRALRLFGFDYRLEIYVPKEKRRWGYYVLPFLSGERLAARVDLKADRARGRLLVPAAYVEEGANPTEVAHALARELRLVADWLGLATISVGRRGSFARRLAESVRPLTADTDDPAAS
jgi:uncharacterized protein YcaQ